ncbi:MAG TPA: hypothetical protein VKZ97_07005, partial [Flavobacteriaceae bacterium]|nr:hypothetical protein [Flavobacteriaceae bacterium]
MLSSLRLLVFLISVIGIYFAYPKLNICIGIAVIGISLFVLLLSKYTNTKQTQNLSKALVRINHDELQIAAGNFHNRENGLEFQQPNHFYSLDIDLFGRGSFFQFINRTSINEATQQLAEHLMANNTQN